METHGLNQYHMFYKWWRDALDRDDLSGFVALHFIKMNENSTCSQVG